MHFTFSTILCILLSTAFCVGAGKSSNADGWVKYEGNPVLGNAELGTCFDVNVIGEGSARYNMYFSWRPKKGNCKNDE